ncbi:MAG: TolC family protein [Sulfurimonas sp.]|nr:TolC family protein [Sulfurimonas sp.]
MKYILLSSLLFFNLHAEIAIEEAWQRVQKLNDGLIASKNDVHRAKLKQDSASSMYLPSVSLGASYTHLDKPIGLDIGEIVPVKHHELDFSEQDILLADLRVIYPLYTGGKIDATQDIYMAKVNESRSKDKMKKDKAFLDLIKVYYGVLISKSLYKTRQEAQDSLQHHFDNAKKLKEQGQIAKIELLNAEVKLDAAKIDARKAKHKLEISTSALHKMIKQNNTPSSSLFISDDISSQSHYADESAENFAIIGVLDAKSQQTLALIDIKKAAWLPQVGAYANVNLYRDDSVLMQTMPNWMAGVALKYELFSRSDRSSDVQAAKLLHSNIAHLKTQAQEDLRLLVEKTYKEMLLYKEEFRSLSSSLALANENYKLREIAFSEGLSTSLEVVDAQVFLSSVKTKRLNALYIYTQKISQLCVLSGDSEMFFKILNNAQEIR